MSYLRFGLMILTSTLVMFILMYLNTYAWEHLFFSETRTYMAIMMGATMSVIMLAYMLGMYANTRINVAIFVGSILVFAFMLWLVRSQTTVTGPSYMRAMIPHHSIAILTSERAHFRDPRVAKLAREIIAAQRREIAEMRYLIADVSAGNVVESIYEDPPARVGSLQDALRNTRIAAMDLAPLPGSEAQRVLERSRCRFHRSPETDPILWAGDDGGVLKLNGVIVPLGAADASADGPLRWTADGLDVTVAALGDEAGWRSNAELVFTLAQGLEAGYRGFWSCDEQ